MPRTRASRIGLVATLACFAFLGAGQLPVSEAQAGSRVVRSGTYWPSWLGKWNVAASRSVGSSIRALGRPARMRTTGSGLGCAMSWPRLGIYMTAWYRGCRSNSPLNEIRITGSAGRANWVTDRGLRIGDSISRMRALYPRARVGRGGYLLMPVRVDWNDCNCLVSPWTARTSNGRVSSLVVYLLAGA